MIPDALNRHAEDLGVTLHQGEQELVDELEALWLSLFDRHLSTGAAGLPVIERAESWPRRRALYEQLLRDQEAFVVVARRGSIASAMPSPISIWDQTTPGRPETGSARWNLSLSFLPNAGAGSGPCCWTTRKPSWIAWERKTS
jgi:hypothetical protein